MKTAQDCRGRRILIVEDEPLITMMIESILEDLGCVIVGPVSRLDKAMTMAKSEKLDAAILDVTIRGGRSFPVAEILLERGIPFVFASGYDDWALPEALRGQRRLTKPFLASTLEDAVRGMCHPEAAL